MTEKWQSWIWIKLYHYYLTAIFVPHQIFPWHLFFSLHPLPPPVNLQEFSALVVGTGRAHSKYWEIHSISNFQFLPTGFMHTDIFPHFQHINNDKKLKHFYRMCIYSIKKIWAPDFFSLTSSFLWTTFKISHLKF